MALQNQPEIKSQSHSRIRFRELIRVSLLLLVRVTDPSLEMHPVQQPPWIISPLISIQEPVDSS